MKYIEIDKTNGKFFILELQDILSGIEDLVEKYKWSIQLIDAVGNIEEVAGMNIMELEKYCDESYQGFILNFEKLVQISKSLEDITDILIVGCESVQKIPKAYKTENWEKFCKVIISREDSSLWQLYSEKESIMNEFERKIK